jgi:hypothetical protein
MQPLLINGASWRAAHVTGVIPAVKAPALALVLVIMGVSQSLVVSGWVSVLA